ncbi:MULTISPECIES: hypothetical protein [Natronorubrum]|uniref:Uncharacterized protein n=2 Tax=Natronorubrum bangense TaxID=61858 RepID=L9W9E8_9EURY|nr:hypothetical protein [Natronorubrum bangense]ELY45906.1 hypothetical protein C494_15088 [Natronorubrum bangense JCM 10635]QCC56646.1 hypothetical protein DV706_19335 [Natronorubrum bangense]
MLPLAGAGQCSSEARYRTRWAVRANHPIWENPDTFTPCRHRRVRRLRGAIAFTSVETECGLVLIDVGPEGFTDALEVHLSDLGWGLEDI